MGRQTCYIRALECLCVAAPQPPPHWRRGQSFLTAFGRVRAPECSLCHESQCLSLGAAPGLPLWEMHLLQAHVFGVRGPCLAPHEGLSGSRSGGLSLKASPGGGWAQVQHRPRPSARTGSSGAEPRLHSLTFARPLGLGVSEPPTSPEQGQGECTVRGSRWVESPHPAW